MRSERCDNATGQCLAFLAAGTIFIGSMGAVLVATSELQIDDGGAREATTANQANSLADLLVSSTGQGWAGGTESMSRLGLAETSGGEVDPTKLNQMIGSKITADGSNNRVDYEEARESLGLTDTGFHLRTMPVEEFSWDMSDLHAAYVAQWTGQNTGFSYNISFSLYLELGTEPEVRRDGQAAAEMDLGDQAIEDREAINALGMDFDDRVDFSTPEPDIQVETVPGVKIPFNTYLETFDDAEGDVFLGSGDQIKNGLANRLDDYDVLVIGGKVDHSVFNNTLFRDAFAAWVADGGIALIMGSHFQDTTWIEPALANGQHGLAGAARTPDPGHPVFSSPNQLDWKVYEVGFPWTMPEEHDDLFDHILSDEDGHYLSISRPGAFGGGFLALAGWYNQLVVTVDVPGQSGDASTGPMAELLENLVVRAAHAELYVELGPPVPTWGANAHAMRHADVEKEPLDPMMLRVEVWVWEE